MRRYIKKIIVHNFMSCKHCETTLDKNLNVVCGESDTGKSTFFKRALLWCLFNELRGDFFIRDNDEGLVDKKGVLLKEDECYVTVIFDDDSEITRKRIKTKNIYNVSTTEGEFFEFENFDNNVPDKVFEVSGMNKLIVDKDNSLILNIPLPKERNVISMTNGNKTKVVGAFAGTNIIDEAVRDVKVDKKNHSTKIKFIEEEITKINTSIEKLGDIDTKAKLIEKCELLFEKRERTKVLIDELSKFKQDIDLKKQTIITLDKEISSKNLIKIDENRLIDLEKIVETIISKVRDRQKMFNGLDTLNKSIKNKRYLIEQESILIKEKPLVLENEKRLLELDLKIKSLDNNFLKVSQKKEKCLDLKSKLSELLNSINICKNNIKKDNIIISAKQSLLEREQLLTQKENRILEIKNEYMSKKNKADEYQKLKISYDNLQKNIGTYKNTIKSLNLVIKGKEKLTILEKRLVELSNLISNLSLKEKETSQKYNILIELQKSTNMRREKENKGVPILEKMKKDLEILINTCVKNIQALGKCPVCNSDLTIEHMKNIREELLR